MLVITQLDAKAIDSLFQDHYTALCRYAYSILKVQDAAEDVVQQLFMTLWEKRNELEVPENPRAYLFRSVYNRCLNEVKRSRYRGGDANSEVLNAIPSDEIASRRVLGSEMEGLIEHAVGTLPEKCQEVFRLSRFEELSYKEIAERMDVSIKTVENHMGKALKLMREALSEYLPQVIIMILVAKGW